MAKKKEKKKETPMQKARRLYGNGSTYKDSSGKTRKRVARASAFLMVALPTPSFKAAVA